MLIILKVSYLYPTTVSYEMIKEHIIQIHAEKSLKINTVD